MRTFDEWINQGENKVNADNVFYAMMKQAYEAGQASAMPESHK